MNYRLIGIGIVVIAVIIGFLVYSFNSALTSIVAESCTHGTTCPMWGTIDFQTNIGIGAMILVLLIGVLLVIWGDIWFTKKSVKEKDYSKQIADMNNEEKQVFDVIVKANGAVFQSELVEKTNLGKVKVTRILDKLEGKGLIERKRRGMTNVVIVKA